ncbi:MAG: hypothetical protein HYT08_03950 [Candidatus Levybacteria bacterium]|nr:hypothetical protein [Candidatus Levybacteria bacterium]
MTWAQLLNWVNDPARTQAELDAVRVTFGLPIVAGATIDDVRNALRVHIGMQPDMTAAIPAAAATAAGWTPTAPAARPWLKRYVGGLVLGAAALLGFLLFFGEDVGLLDDDLIDDGGNGKAIVQTSDSDGDGYSDVVESANGTDPNDATSYPGSNGNGNGNTTVTTSGNGSTTYSGPCQPGDKVGTWSEGSIQNPIPPYRIEMGGHGGQHFDFYPQVGVKAVSFIVDPIANPDGVPSIAFGYGSLWEWNPPGCTYDYVADATAYARARLDSDHSGLVVDLRTSPPKVVANVVNMSQDAIAALLAQDYAAMQRDGQQFQPGTASTSSNVPAPAPQAQAPAQQQSIQQAQPAPAPAASCPDGIREDFKPIPGTNWSPGPTDSFRVVNLWSNWPGFDQTKVTKFLLWPGEEPNFQGGGDSHSWPANCQQAAEAEYAANPNPAGR